MPDVTKTTTRLNYIYFTKVEKVKKMCRALQEKRPMSSYGASPAIAECSPP